MKLFIALLSILLLTSCNDNKMLDEVPSATYKSQIETESTNNTIEPAFLSEEDIEQNSEEYFIVTIYDRVEDINGKKIEARDSSGKLLTVSNGFSIDDSNLIIDDDKPLKFVFDLNKGAVDTETWNENEFVELSCLVYLDNKIEKKCANSLKLPNLLGTEQSVYLIKNKNDEFELSLTE